MYLYMDWNVQQVIIIGVYGGFYFLSEHMFHAPAITLHISLNITGSTGCNYRATLFGTTVEIIYPLWRQFFFYCSCLIIVPFPIFI